MIGGLLVTLLPTLALAQTKVDLGDGVSVVFPSAPAKRHREPEQPADPSKGAETGLHEAIGATDTWSLRIGGAGFYANALTQRQPPGGAPARDCSGPPLPVPPGSFSPCGSSPADLASPPETRKIMPGGALYLSRVVQVNGRIYGVTFTRQSEDQLAKYNLGAETPPESAGEAFVSSFKVATPPAK
jgi:hypothetical protein